MGGSADERPGSKGAETAGETRQRGETGPGRIETKRKKDLYPVPSSAVKLYITVTFHSICVVSTFFTSFWI